MDKTSLINKIKEFGLNTREEYMAEAFSRNIGLLTQAEQDKLANATVAIPGMGGVGGVHLITMTRTGVGNFHIADFDTYEPANINRQLGDFFGGVSGAAITVRYNNIAKEIAGNKRLKRKAGKIKARIINI